MCELLFHFSLFILHSPDKAVNLKITIEDGSLRKYVDAETSV